jgi:hypothetical protein
MGARAARPHGGAPVAAVVVGGWCSVGEGKTKRREGNAIGETSEPPKKLFMDDLCWCQNVHRALLGGMLMETGFFKSKKWPLRI